MPLSQVDGKLHYLDPENQFPPLAIDFNSAELQYRLRTTGKRQPLAKAVSIKGSLDIDIIDATAGMGKDAWTLAYLGCRVTMIEQSDIIAPLLQDALKQASQHQNLALIAANIKLIHGNACDLLPTLPKTDVIYLDPMFPESRKSAKAPQDMQTLQTLIGHQDADTLLETALRHDAYKVVLKRPNHAPVLRPEQLNYQTKTKSGRFDAYLTQLHVIAKR